MKRTAKILAFVMAMLMMASSFSVISFAATVEAPMSDYDDYGYYAYFDFEKYGSASDHMSYMRNVGATNADGLLCDPYGFMLNDQGFADGTGVIITESNGNNYYHYTTKGSRDYNAIAVFGLHKDGENYVLGETTEVSFKFRIDASSDSSVITEGERLNLVIPRRGSAKGNYAHLTADVYGNIYAYVNGSFKMVYKNADGKTVGGDGEFMEIVFRWYDNTNTYSVWLDGYPLVQGMTMAYNYRYYTYKDNVEDKPFVDIKYDDNFKVESMDVVGSSDTVTSGADNRSIEVLRYDGKKAGFVYDVDDVKLCRVESAQGGKVFYENSFDGVAEGFSAINTRNGSYLYAPGAGTGNVYLSEADSEGNKYLNLAADQFFSLDDKYYQAFTQGNIVIEFSLKMKPTHASGYKALVRINDSFCSNMYKLLWVDENGYLYKEENNLNTRIDGYKLDGTEWLDIAVVGIKNTDNYGKFSSFSEANRNSAVYDQYYFAFYINGEFVGTTNNRDLSRFTGSTYNEKKITTSGHEYVITDYADASALDLSALTLVDGTTTANHKIYKSVTDGIVTYYDVTFSGDTATKYSTMVLSAKSIADDENIRILTDTCGDAMLDNIRIYEATAPDFVYEGANSVSGGTVLDVNFANYVFPSNNVNARTGSAGADVLGSFITSGFKTTHMVRKDANGNQVTAANTLDAAYGTLNASAGQWFDFFVPMPKMVNGAYDFTYSFESSVKGFNFDNEKAPDSIILFSPRFEDNAGYYAASLMNVNKELKVFVGNSTTRNLYKANGEELTLDNANWNDLRVDVHFTKSAGSSSLDATYYYGNELLYFADGTAASGITDIFSANVVNRVGVSNVRLRYFPQLATGKALSFDSKGITITSRAKPVYTELSEGFANFSGGVTAIEITIPKYESATGAEYDALSLVKVKDGASHKLPLVTVNSAKSEVLIGVGGRSYELLDASGKALTVPVAGLPLSIVYDDNYGLVRYYANGAPAYVNLGSGNRVAAEVGIFDNSFADLGMVGEYKYVVFGGYADEADIMDNGDYKISTYAINNGDTAELIGFQMNDDSESIRMIAGVDTLYYTAVGFELETFVGGASMGVKTVATDKVFGSIVAGGKTVTAESLGYKYLAANIVTDLPDDVTDGSYIMIRSFTEVEGNKHYDNEVKLVVENGGYYFDNDGTVYQTNFNGIKDLPSEWKLDGNADHISAGNFSASVTDKGEVKLSGKVNDKAFLILDQYIGEDYLFQADITVESYDTSISPYFAPVFGYESTNKFGYAYIKHVEASGVQGKIQCYKAPDWIDADYGSFSAADLGVAIEEGKTYTVTIVKKGNHIAFFMNGCLVTECDFADKLADGKIGFCSKGMDILVDNVVVKTGEYADDNYFVYEENFDGVTVLPEKWGVTAGNNYTNIYVTEDGKLRLIEPKGNYSIAYYNENMTTDYVVEAEVTITDRETVHRYMGLATHFTDASNNVTCWVRVNGEGGISSRIGGNSTSLATFNLADKGLVLELGKAVTLKAIVQGDSIKFYVDGVFIAEGTVPAEATGKKTGVIASGVNIDLDNFTLSKAAGVNDASTYIQSFDGATTLPSEWTAVDTSSNRFVGTDKGIYIVSTDGGHLPQIYLKDMIKDGDTVLSDYIVEADFVLGEGSNTGGYLGIVVRSNGVSANDAIRNGVFCATRVGGHGTWVQANNSTNYATEGQANKTINALVAGERHTMKVVCLGNNVDLYIDGQWVAGGEKPSSLAENEFNTGTIGFAAKNAKVTFDNVKVSTVGENPKVLLYSGFGELNALSDAWNSVPGKGSVTLVADTGSMVISESSTTVFTHAVLNDSANVNYDDYVITANVAVMNTGNYLGVQARYTNDGGKSYALATVRQNGRGAIEFMSPSGWVSGYAYSFDLGKALELGKIYALEVKCEGDNISLSIDGTEVASGTMPEGFESGTVGIGGKGIKFEVDNFKVSPITGETEPEVIYTQTFDTAASAPAHWVHIEEAQRTDNFVPEMTVVANAKTLGDTALSVTAMESGLTVIGLDKLLELDSFSFSADVTMIEKSTLSGVSYYMGPAFGIREDGQCVLAALKVTDGTWNAEAWHTNANTTKWTSYASGTFGTTALHQTYNMRVVGVDRTVTFYIDGNKQATFDIDEAFKDGLFGIAFRNSEIIVDNVKITKGIEHFEVRDTENPTTRIRVATFNIGDFSTASGTANIGIEKGNGTDKTKEEYRAVFEKVGADIWGLQEDSQYFNGNTKESPFDAIYSVVHTNYGRKFSGGYNGKAFLTSFDLYDVKQVYYKPAITSYAPSGTTSYGHPWFLAGKVLVDGKEITLISLHFDWACKERRFQQIADVIEYAQQFEYSIILGDFNPENYVNGNKVADPNDEHYVNGFDYVNMYQVDWKFFTDAGFEPANGGRFGAFETLVNNGNPRGGFPWDSVFVSSNIKIVNAYPVYESWMNDHAIFVADLELN